MYEPTNQEWKEWESYFAAQDLGELEDVREYVDTHCMQNCFDIPNGSDFLSTAMLTLGSYLDEPENAREVFNAYRSENNRK